ncbi:hypothetical protein Ciccas_007178 [Cichlidogyrus casuarinus]|uniref:Uncharacterized protein n=1 Tax=Cichlidogyrus casuarinus TaxID=1844966 RepID=A0ABD2Q3M3_9PLAT
MDSASKMILSPTPKAAAERGDTRCNLKVEVPPERLIPPVSRLKFHYLYRYPDYNKTLFDGPQQGNYLSDVEIKTDQDMGIHSVLLLPKGNGLIYGKADSEITVSWPHVNQHF